MMIPLMFIAGVYGFCVVLVNVAHRFRNPDGTRLVHAVLVTRNNELHIEWYVRSLVFVSWLKGRNLQVTVLDEGSTDDTVAILERMAGMCAMLDLQVCTTAEAADEAVSRLEKEAVLFVRLSRSERLVELPQLP